MHIFESTILSDAPVDALGTPLSERTAPRLELWLAERVALHLQRAPEDIDPHTPLADYGMDSVAAIGICGEIEQRYLLAVSPTIAFDYPTVHALAGHLAERLGETDTRTGGDT